jgi:hypothetical protein
MITTTKFEEPRPHLSPLTSRLFQQTAELPDEKMEVNAFLCSMPFFLQRHTSSSSWWTANIDGRREILLSDYHVSIEPITKPSVNDQVARINDDIKEVVTLGPAFFGGKVATSMARGDGDQAGTHILRGGDDDDHTESDLDSDPALFKFEIAIYTSSSAAASPQKSPSPVKSRIAGSLTASMHQPSGSSIGHVETAVFFRIGTQVVQVDVQQVVDLKVQAHLDEELSTLNKPPSLVLQFSSLCRFRAFSLSTDPPADQFSALSYARARLSTILASATPLTQRFDTRNLASPSGSSVTHSSSNEHGQRDITTVATTRTNDDSPFHDQHHDQDTDSTKRKRDEGGGAVDNNMDEIQRRQIALEQCRNGLVSLQQLLHIPIYRTTEVRNDAKDDQEQSLQLSPNGGEHVGVLLTLMAENLSSSYCSREQLLRATQSYDSARSASQAQLDDLLKEFFPSSRPKKRFRGGEHHPKPHGSTGNYQRQPPQTTKKGLLARATSLLRQQNDTVESRHRISILPHRG